MVNKCHKLSFYSAKEARKYVKLLRPNCSRKGYPSDLSKLRPYQCYKCDQYHLTSQSKSAARRSRYERTHRAKPLDNE